MPISVVNTNADVDVDADANVTVLVGKQQRQKQQQRQRHQKRGSKAKQSKNKNIITISVVNKGCECVKEKKENTHKTRGGILLPHQVQEPEVIRIKRQSTTLLLVIDNSSVKPSAVQHISNLAAIQAHPFLCRPSSLLLHIPAATMYSLLLAHADLGLVAAREVRTLTSGRLCSGQISAEARITWWSPSDDFLAVSAGALRLLFSQVLPVGLLSEPLNLGLEVANISLVLFFVILLNGLSPNCGLDGAADAAAAMAFVV